MQCNVILTFYCTLQIFVITIAHLLAANNKRTEIWKEGKSTNVWVPDKESRTAIGVDSAVDLHFTEAKGKLGDDISHISLKKSISGYNLDYQHFTKREKKLDNAQNQVTIKNKDKFIGKIKFDDLDKIDIDKSGVNPHNHGDQEIIDYAVSEIKGGMLELLKRAAENKDMNSPSSSSVSV